MTRVDRDTTTRRHSSRDDVTSSSSQRSSAADSAAVVILSRHVSTDSRTRAPYKQTRCIDTGLVEPLSAEHIGQGGQSPANFVCPGESILACHHFSASKLIFLPFHIELIRIIMHVTIMKNKFHGVAL